MLKYLTKQADALEQAQNFAVFVGLPKDNIGQAVYGDGQTVLEIGIRHEYGVPEEGLPQRSFIRGPIRAKQDELDKQIATQLENVASGKTNVPVALGRIGTLAVNAIKGAFISGGYGEWKPLLAQTIALKKSSQILIDTGLLRRSISWVIRRVA